MTSNLSNSRTVDFKFYDRLVISELEQRRSVALVSFFELLYSFAAENQVSRRGKMTQRKTKHWCIERLETRQLMSQNACAAMWRDIVKCCLNLVQVLFQRCTLEETFLILNHLDAINADKFFCLPNCWAIQELTGETMIAIVIFIVKALNFEKSSRYN